MDDDDADSGLYFTPHTISSQSQVPATIYPASPRCRTPFTQPAMRITHHLSSQSQEPRTMYPASHRYHAPFTQPVSSTPHHLSSQSQVPDPISPASLPICLWQSGNLVLVPRDQRSYLWTCATPSASFLLTSATVQLSWAYSFYGHVSNYLSREQRSKGAG